LNAIFVGNGHIIHSGLPVGKNSEIVPPSKPPTVTHATPEQLQAILLELGIDSNKPIHRDKTEQQKKSLIKHLAAQKDNNKDAHYGHPNIENDLLKERIL
jgi:hypothetical protein